VLQGEKVVLRGPEKEDLPELHKMMNGEELMGWARFRPDHMVSMVALGKEYDHELKGEAEGRRTFVVVERPTGKTVGWATLRWWRLSRSSADVGLALMMESRGKGCGTGVVRQLRALAFDQNGMHRVELGTRAENAGMQKAAGSLGFRREGLLREALCFDGKHQDPVLMGLLKGGFRR
jgi:RimJ/RimL family protein N-acetyltransferase